MRNTKRAVYSIAIFNSVSNERVIVVPLTVIRIATFEECLFATLVALPGDMFVSVGWADELASADPLYIAGLTE